MKNTKSALEKKKMILLLVAVVLVATVAFTVGFQLWKHSKKEKEKINQGIAYLRVWKNRIFLQSVVKLML